MAASERSLTLDFMTSDIRQPVGFACKVHIHTVAQLLGHKRFAHSSWVSAIFPGFVGRRSPARLAVVFALPCHQGVPADGTPMWRDG